MVEQHKKTFAVKLKGLAPWISEITYQKEELDLTLYFTLKKQAELNIIVEDQDFGVKRLLPTASPLGPLSQRLIANVEYKPNLDLYITQLFRKDFAECKATPLALKGAVEELKQYGGDASSLLVLFETNAGSQGLLWSRKPEVRDRVKTLRQGTEKGNWVLFFAKEPLGALKQQVAEKI